MKELKRMRAYVDKTNIPQKVRNRYCINMGELEELIKNGTTDIDGLFYSIAWAFDYGVAKGYRAAKAEAKGATA